MHRFPTFRGLAKIVHGLTTVLSVSLLITLRVESSCSPESVPLARALRAAPSHELYELGLGEA